MSNDEITTYFPQAFFSSLNLLEKDYLTKIQNKAFKIKENSKSGGDNWTLKPFNTCGTYDLQKDKDFKILLDKIEEKTLKFTKEHNTDHVYHIKDAWLNVYNKDESQEFHCHGGSTFSAVFFLKSSDNCANLIFENPTEPDMKPIIGVKKENPLTYKRCWIKPVENSLIIFRSYMRHMVEKQTTDFDRMTIAVNF